MSSVTAAHQLLDRRGVLGRSCGSISPSNADVREERLSDISSADEKVEDLVGEIPRRGRACNCVRALLRCVSVPDASTGLAISASKVAAVDDALRAARAPT
jgi:hypothetical protein